MKRKIVKFTPKIFLVMNDGEIDETDTGDE